MALLDRSEAGLGAAVVFFGAGAGWTARPRMREAGLALRILTALLVAGRTYGNLALTGLGRCASVWDLGHGRGGRLLRKRERAADEDDTEQKESADHAGMLPRGSRGDLFASAKLQVLCG